MAREHQMEVAESPTSLNFSESSSPHVIYRESSSGGFTPRVVLFDLDATTIDTLKMGADKALFKKAALISGSEGAGNCYARGRYVQGLEILHSCRNALRMEIEGCDHCDAVIHNGATSGGTGSGLTPDILSAEDSRRNFETITLQVYPSLSYDNAAGYYNTVLHMDAMTDMVDMNFMIDNQSLYAIGERRYETHRPLAYADINQQIAAMYSSLTCGDRFSGDNFDMRRMQTGLIPYVGLSYLAVTVSSYEEPVNRTLPFGDIMQAGFNCLPSVSIDKRQGKYLGLYILARGQCHQNGQMYQQIRELCNARNFVKWTPCKFSMGHCSESIPDHPPFFQGNRACIHFFNHSAIVGPLKSYAKWFGVGYTKKAFLHWYTKNGMPETEMEKALQSSTILQRVYTSVAQIDSGSKDLL